MHAVHGDALQLRLKVSWHLRLQVTNTTREITSVPMRKSCCRRDRLQSCGALVKRAHASLVRCPGRVENLRKIPAALGLSANSTRLAEKRAGPLTMKASRQWSPLVHAYLVDHVRAPSASVHACVPHGMSHAQELCPNPVRGRQPRGRPGVAELVGGTRKSVGMRQRTGGHQACT